MKRIANGAASLLLMLALIQFAEAQTYSVIHSFSGGQDGANPVSIPRQSRGL